MYELIKVIAWLISPLTICLFLTFVAMVLVARGHYRRGLQLGILVLSAMWVASTPAFAHMLTRSIEQRYPALPVDAFEKADAALLLGGGVAGAINPDRPQLHLSKGATRVWMAAQLYNAGRVARILVSGGDGFETPSMQRSAEATRILLNAMGVPNEAIDLEYNSRDTIENAKLSRSIFEKNHLNKILLVTSAVHMPRALELVRRAFASTDIIILPASTDVEGLPTTLHPIGRFFPTIFGLDLTTRAIKEIIGYTVLSFSSEFGRV